MVRRGLAAFLSAVDDFEWAGEAAGGEPALAAINTLAHEGRLPDVALIDLMTELATKSPQRVLGTAAYYPGTRVDEVLAVGILAYELATGVNPMVDEVAAGLPLAG